MRYSTPLRYPGGKAKIANFIKLIYRRNELLDGHYAEPYAGGAGVALSLLFQEYASHIHINDLDDSIYTFWDAALNHTEKLCDLISKTPVTVKEWEKQKKIQLHREEYGTLDLGFSTFFLNRTNRSGIINAGIIGGKDQSGEWKIDARYNKIELIQRLRKIGSYKNRISIYKQDAADFIRDILPELPRKTLAYLDPPYFIKGHRLYRNFYKKKDHQHIAEIMASVVQNWIVSYDNVPEIEQLYSRSRKITYDLNYSAREHTTGSEIMFFSDDILIPDVANPSKVTSKMLVQSFKPSAETTLRLPFGA